MSTEEPSDANSNVSRPETWGQRHGVTILTTVLFGLLALIMVVQVAC